MTLPAGHARHLVDRCTLGLTEHGNYHILLGGALRVGLRLRDRQQFDCRPQLIDQGVAVANFLSLFDTRQSVPQRQQPLGAERGSVQFLVRCNGNLAVIDCRRRLAAPSTSSVISAFISGPVSFFTLRFLLGLAEAGFFPGMILYFTYWFPPSHRARIVAGFMAAIPISIGLGAPISTSLLELDGVLGIAGWRWLFLCEAAPAVIFGIATFFYLTDRPAQARWLEAEEREWLATEMEKERQTVATGRTISVVQSLFNPRVLALAAIHFGQAGVSVGIAVFAAQIIKQLGLTNMQTGFATAIPYALGTIGMIVWGSYSDRKNERRWNLTASCTTMALGCLIAGLLGASYWSVLGLSLATIRS